jgi:hypothetical protein
MNKNTGHFVAFDKQWFVKNQGILLFLLNSPLTRKFSRYTLRITKQDVGYKGKIVELAPSYYTLELGRFGDSVKLVTDFRTHPKYAKRIYFAFKPLWWALHVWDFMIADRIAPGLSFGFSTLTAYPAVGAAAPVDGYVMRQATSESFATIRAGAGTVAGPSATLGATPWLRAHASTANTYNDFGRGIYGFDTSPIGGGVISAAVLSLATNIAPETFLGDTDVDVVAATPASNNNLVAADFTTLGTTRYATGKAVSTFSSVDGTYNDLTLNATGIAAINGSGYTFLGTRLKWDTDNSFTGTWVSGSKSTAFIGYFADQTGTSTDPKLVVTYLLSITISETVAVTASLLKTTSRIFSDKIAITDTITAVRIYAQEVVESIAIYASIFRTITRTFIESIGVSATIESVRSRLATLTEIVGITASMVKQQNKVLSETIGILDSTVKILNGLLVGIWRRRARPIITWSKRARHDGS